MSPRLVAWLLLSRAASSFRISVPWSQPFRAVYIWSPGHAGTTTLFKALKALDLPGVVVDFERTPKHSPLSACQRFSCDRVLTECADDLHRAQAIRVLWVIILTGKRRAETCA